jgi:hypothetical protein
MFLFYKYATILHSLERAAYIKHHRAESDGWQSSACLLFNEYLRVPLKGKGRVRPSRSALVSLHGLSRHHTLKGDASSVAFRYMMDLEAFRMDSKVPF